MQSAPTMSATCKVTRVTSRALTVIVSTPTPEQRRDYALNIEIHRNTLDRCRAGARVRDLWQKIMSEYSPPSAGPTTTMLIGHGVWGGGTSREPILRTDRANWCWRRACDC